MPQPNPHHDDRAAAARRDSAASERMAIRRLLRQMRAVEGGLARDMRDLEQGQERARDEIEEDWRVASGGRDPRRPWAWRSGGDAAAQTSDRGVSWRALRPGADVIASDGVRVGALQEVLADSEADIFEGIVIDIRTGPGGLRVAQATQIALMFERRVVLTLSRDEVRRLPAPRRPGARDRFPRRLLPRGRNGRA
jgi:hypothetical protein